MIPIKIQTLTPLWTGGVNKDCDRLHETGIIGSLRWWYEAIIRELGRTACDPTDSKCEGNKHCAACELFGCTGWSRKFRFLIFNEDNSIAKQIESGKNYTFKFIPLKHIHDEEEFLLFHTVKIISDIGSMGGKTVLKPSELKLKNNKAHHADYGLIRLTSEYTGKIIPKDNICEFLKKFEQANNVKKSDELPALNNFWFIANCYLTRSKMNNIVGRASNGKYKNNASDLQQWMGGSIGNSKKIFSFHNEEAKRTWGYAKDGQLKDVIKLLLDNGIKNIKTGESLLQSIFNKGN